MSDKPTLKEFETIRPKILSDVIDLTLQDFKDRPLDSALEEALFLERYRMRHVRRFDPSKWFTTLRYLKDRKLWSRVHRGMLKRAGENNLQKRFRDVVSHYAEEIGGHFNPKIYDLAIRVVPLGFNWLLNAASLNHFRPWGQKQLLTERLKITGQIKELQALSQKGTILLVPTHQSNIDSVLIGYVIYLLGLPPHSYGAGLNLFSDPILSFFMRGLGAYTVDRQKSSQIYKSTLKNYSTRIIEAGIHSIFFPGGGRARSGGIETKLKLGLLGTGLAAQIKNLQQGRENPNVYVVPMTISYDFVLEASSLIEQYLSDLGRERFLGADTDEPFPLLKVIRFFWRFFKSEAQVTARVGQALDVFGNPVDENGHSKGPNQTTIEPSRWLTTRGELCELPPRDQQYTRELGIQIVNQFYRNNTVGPTQLLPFAFFRALRKKYPDHDLFHLMRLSIQQRTLPVSAVIDESELLLAQVNELATRGELVLADELKNETGALRPVTDWLQPGVKRLGALHDLAVLKIDEDVLFTEDMSLLYYYRNRLSGYGLSLHGDFGGATKRRRGETDEKGFLV